MKLPSPATDPAAEAFRARLCGLPWRVMRSEAAPGSANMAYDLALLEGAEREETPPTLRFYAWSPPAVSLGRFQAAEGVDCDYLRARGWDLVRRPTGGRAVLHQHELTYSVTVPPSLVAGVGVRAGYAVLSRALNLGLTTLLPAVSGPAAPGVCQVPARGEANCFALASECDTLVPGGKLAGSAQVRSRGALLQHGSILLDAEPEAWEALFGSAGRLVTLKGLLGFTPPRERVEEAVLGGFRALGVEIAARTSGRAGFVWGAGTHEM